MRDQEETALRARFAELRATRDVATPPLGRVLAGAEKRRRTARSAARRRLLYACAAAPLSGTLVAYGLDRAAAREQARLLADAEVITHWRAPTDYLLVDPSLAWLSAGPTIESVVIVTDYQTAGGSP